MPHYWQEITSHNVTVVHYGATHYSVRSGAYSTNCRSGHRLLCSDGVIRAANLAPTPDSFFSTPAQVRVGGKSVKGYMTHESYWCDFRKMEFVVLVFRQHLNQRPEVPRLPLWPTSSHSEEMRELLEHAFTDDED